MGAVLLVFFANGSDILLQAGVFYVVAKLVRQDPGDTGLGGGFDQLCLVLRWCHCVHGDDESVVASESVHDGCLIGIIDFFDLATLRDFVGAVCTGKGCDFVFSQFEHLLCHEFAGLAASLLSCMSFVLVGGGL